MQVVADKAAQRSSIEGQLAERQRLLSSIKDQIASLEAAERRRQERLAAQAQARFRAAQQAPSEEAAPEALVQSDSPAEAIAPAPDARYGGVVGIAMQYLGVPYVWGGASPSGFDCSGLIMYVYAQVGVSLPHHAASQYGMGTPVSRDQLQPGDLVFFNGLGHAGSTSAAASSSTRRTPATSSRSPASPTPGTRPPGSARGVSKPPAAVATSESVPAQMPAAWFSVSPS